MNQDVLMVRRKKTESKIRALLPSVDGQLAGWLKESKTSNQIL